MCKAATLRLLLIIVPGIPEAILTELKSCHMRICKATINSNAHVRQKAMCLHLKTANIYR